MCTLALISMWKSDMAQHVDSQIEERPQNMESSHYNWSGWKWKWVFRKVPWEKSPFWLVLPSGLFVPRPRKDFKGAVTFFIGCTMCGSIECSSRRKSSNSTRLNKGQKPPWEIQIQQWIISILSPMNSTTMTSKGNSATTSSVPNVVGANAGITSPSFPSACY